MRTQNEVCVVGTTQIAIGTSSIIRVLPMANQVAVSIKRASGGSLELVQPAYSGASTSTGGWASGWLFGTEYLRFEGPSVLYLASTGATAVASLAFEFSNGATIL